jgi:hypothetical protein
LEHPDKLDEFNERYYPEMAEKFKKATEAE